jgi:NAD+ diphosphatase
MDEYNSNITIPQMVFLGLDERTGGAKTERTSGEEDGGGFKWKEVYKGAPLFAVDVTPKGSITEKCEELIKEVTEKKGLEFLQGNRNMILSFPAAEGMSGLLHPYITLLSLEAMRA